MLRHPRENKPVGRSFEGRPSGGASVVLRNQTHGSPLSPGWRGGRDRVSRPVECSKGWQPNGFRSLAENIPDSSAYAREGVNTVRRQPEFNAPARTGGCFPSCTCAPFIAALIARFTACRALRRPIGVSMNARVRAPTCTRGGAMGPLRRHHADTLRLRFPVDPVRRRSGRSRPGARRRNPAPAVPVC